MKKLISQYTVILAPISTKSLTYRKVTDMLDGISKGNSYNYLGMPLEAGQNPLSEAQLLTLKTQLEPKRELTSKNCAYMLQWNLVTSHFDGS